MSRCLLENVEVDVREPTGLDTLEEPPERRGIGHIGCLGLARTGSENSTDAATDVDDDRARITGLGEDVRRAVIVDDTPFHRGLVNGRVVEEVVADNGEHAVGAADGGPGGISVLDHQQAVYRPRRTCQGYASTRPR